MMSSVFMQASVVTVLVSWSVVLLAWSVTLVRMRREHEAFARRIVDVVEKSKELMAMHQERFESLQGMHRQIAASVHGLDQLVSMVRRLGNSQAMERIQ